MKLAVSSIAWEPDEELSIVDMMMGLGVEQIEVAPTKQWPNLLEVDLATVSAYREFWNARGIEVVAMQSLLFGRPDLTVFESQSKRDEGIAYFGKVMKIAHTLGAKKLVYGSPKNRKRGSLNDDEIQDIAVGYFRRLGELAEHNDVILCIEPNPREYQCDFITNAEQARRLVDAVNNKGFGLHLDAGGATLANDDLIKLINADIASVNHFHISEPFLEAVGEPHGVDHEGIASALRKAKYPGTVSIEMRAGGDNNKRALEAAIVYAQQTYLD